MILRTVRRGAAALALVLAPCLAFAQGQPLFQSGTVTPNHLLKGAGNGLQMDAGGLTGDANGRGVSPFSITDASGLGLCSNTAVTGGQHHAFCLGHDADGNALLSLTANGGALEKSLFLSKHGTLYEIPFVGAGSGNVVGPGSSTVNEVVSFNSAAGVLLRQGPAAITDSKATVTADGAGLTTRSNTTYTANQIYQMTTPVTVSTYDAVRGVAVSTAGSTTTGVNGLAGYVVGDTALGGGGTSASPVALFGTGIANANGAVVWGINTLLTDNSSQTVSGGVGRELWNELDFNVTSTGTTVRGLMLTGASIAQPTLSVGFEVRPLGTGIEWTTAYATQDGAAVNGLALGTQVLAGVSSPSQLLLMAWSDGAAGVFNHTLQSAGGNMTLDSTSIAGTGNFILNKGGFRTVDAGSVSGLVLGQLNAAGVESASQSLHFGYTNPALAAFNHSFQATADGVLNLLTSGAAPSGSFKIPTGAAYKVGVATGVTCSGAPTAGFASVGGIVTAC